MLSDIALLDKKNKDFKNLSLLPGFNLKDPPKKVDDTFRVNNHLILSNNDIIDEKIFIKLFSLVENNEDNKKFRKTRKKKHVKKNKETKKK